MSKNKLTFDQNGFYLDGKPFRIIAGDIHYFRIHPDDWARRLALAVDFGLNTVQTYVPWNGHEKKDGSYCFEGIYDLAAYLEACAKAGLYVLLRPAPYICSEWELGGLPARLLANGGVEIRTSDPRYMAEVRRFYEALVPVFRPYLATNGGPIIAVALENEYGSYGDDRAYIDGLADILRELGVDVPLYSTDGHFEPMMMSGKHKDDFLGLNFRAASGQPTEAYNNNRKFYPDYPFFSGELWAGRAMHWGEPFVRRDQNETPEAFRELLALGGSVSFYMFSGGTNFGFMGGANYGVSYSARPGTPNRYIPMLTSYDVDAMLAEDGEPTPKYYIARDFLDECLGREKRPHVLPVPARQKQTLSVKLDEAAYLFDNLDALSDKCVKETVPHYMEDHGQSYGMILYTVNTPGFIQNSPWPWGLNVKEMKDRATVFANGDYLATFMRDRGVKTDGAAVDADATGKVAVWEPDGNPTRFDVLVENMGRINFGNWMTAERKGMRGLLYAGHCFMGYETRTLPLDDLSGLSFKPYSADAFKKHAPIFLRGHFDAKAGVDTYIDMHGFGHGYVFVNGVNLGRYDEAGPQYTLYLPGGWLRDKDNEIIVLDVDPTVPHTVITATDHLILEGDAKELS